MMIMKNKISKADFEEYYKNHSQRSTCEHFNISQYIFNKYMEEFELQKHTHAETIRLGCLEKYGVENVFELSEKQEKGRATKKERYGSETYHNVDKTKQTNLEKYGSPSPLGNEDVRKKAQESYIEHYGVSNPFQAAEVQEKIKATKEVLYGNPDFTNREKASLTLLENFGVTNPGQIEELKQTRFDTMKATNLEKYGVPYYVMTEDCTMANGGKSSESIPNRHFRELLEKNNIPYETEFPIKNYLFDFKVNSTLIEINPFATHNSTWGIFNQPKDRNYHKQKTDMAHEAGFNCINIWDWDNVEMLIEQLKEKEIVYARELSISQITDNSAIKEFENQNHFQGYCNLQKICYGLYLNEELIQLMTFGTPRYNLHAEYELLRLCTKSGFSVVGGAERLFKKFISDYTPNSIVSYCDSSKFTGTVYTKLGFVLKSSGSPSKHWYNPKTKQHITDNLLRKKGFDKLFNANYGKGTSNNDLMLETGFVEIYDAGQKTFIWTKE